MSTMMSDDFILEVEQHDEFKMWQGLIGPYYYPSVDAIGNISWTNNGGLTNPATVNIAGRGLEIVGIVETTAELPETADDYVTYLVGEEAPYSAYIYDGGTWVNLGIVAQGDKGDKGDPGEGVPTGGTTGQVLKKVSSTNYDTTWGDVEALPTGGTTGQVLSKASNTDYDVEWADASGGDVQTVNSVQPDANGNVLITADDIGTDATNISIQDALDGYVHVGTSAPTDPTTKIWLDTDEPGMSGVSSVNGATGTVVLDADDVGAMSKMDLLWTNASPTSSFANQTITLDLSDYDAVLVKSKIVTDINGVFSQLFFKSSGYSYLFFAYTHIFYRFLEISDSGIVFGHCNYLSNYAQSGFSVGDNYAIPLQIYGVKVVA